MILILQYLSGQEKTRSKQIVGEHRVNIKQEKNIHVFLFLIEDSTMLELH